MYETSQRVFTRCACARRTGFLIKFFNQESVLVRKKVELLMNRKELAKRYILFVVSLFFAALGVAVTKRGELGTSPTSSVANVMGGRFEGMTMGVCLIV